MRKTKIRNLVDEITELFLSYETRFKSEIVLYLVYLQGAHIQGRYRNKREPAADGPADVDEPTDRWRHCPEVMSLFLYWLGYNEEEIGNFSCRKVDPGISQQAASKRLGHGGDIFKKNFGRDLRETPGLKISDNLVRARAFLLGLIFEYVGELQADGREVADVEKLADEFAGFLEERVGRGRTPKSLVAGK